MNNVIKIALLSQYKDNQIEGLLEVINSSRDPELACEILLDIYKPLVFAPFGEPMDKDETDYREFISYNKWEKVVTFKKHFHQRDIRWFKSQELADSANDVDKRTTNSYTYREYDLGIKTQLATCSLSNWKNVEIK